jgi:AP-2 complex subunit alpha
LSSTSKAFVKKKAALTLLRLYRKYPGIVRNEWAERIISIMDDPDMGVTLSVTSLVMALAQDLPEEYKGCYVKAAQRLKRIVVDNDIAPDYLYYRVPCPWIQVKFLRLLQYYPPSGMFWSFVYSSLNHSQSLQRTAMFARLSESPSPK